MKGIAIVAIGFVVLLVLLLSGVLSPLMSSLYHVLMGTSNSDEPSPYESVTPLFSATPQRISNISIYYNFKTVQSISSQGVPFTPDSGNVFLEVTMKIENNGYDNVFSTNPALFSAKANGTNYDVDTFGTGSLGDWGTVNVANGDSFRGTLVFQVPEMASSFTFGYLQPISLSRFIIVWIQT